jgi:predicted amidophosphoribosyltransferase
VGDLMRVNGRRCTRCKRNAPHEESEPLCMDCMDEIETIRAEALASAERAVLSAAKAWREADRAPSEAAHDSESMEMLLRESDAALRALRAAADALAKMEEGNG